MADRELNGNRTHEPDLRELTAQLDALHSLMDERHKALHALLVERDRRYEDRFKAGDVAVQAALAASKEITSAAFAASKEAIVKAEESQKSYNATHNDLVRKMEMQAQATMPRLEIESREMRTFEALESTRKEAVSIKDELRREISDLRKSRDEGKGLGQFASVAFSVLSFLVAVAAVLAVLWKR